MMLEVALSYSFHVPTNAAESIDTDVDGHGSKKGVRKDSKMTLAGNASRHTIDWDVHTPHQHQKVTRVNVTEVNE